MKLIWLVVAIVFAIGEAMTPSLTLIWFSIGALLVLVFSSFIDSILLQIILFAIVSISLLFIATKNIVKKDKDYKYNTNLQGMIGKVGTVKSDILKNNVGIVVVDGEKWSAISINNDIIKKEESVEVIKIEGVKLIVRKINR